MLSDQNKSLAIKAAGGIALVGVLAFLYFNRSEEKQ
jgi:hypothetical protein